MVWPKPARPEMHADPERARFVGEDVHVVIAAADRAELLRAPSSRAHRARASRRPRAAPPTPGDSNSGSSTGASLDSFLRPTPNEIVTLDLARRARSSVGAIEVHRASGSVRIAALPQAMSNPTPTTDAWLSYAATPPMGMT